jgi:hypothetical protein
LVEALERRQETDAIARERAAFRRYQAAMQVANQHFVPMHDGVPIAPINSDSLAAVTACDTAHDEWLAAKAEVDRILEEIRSGKRR